MRSGSLCHLIESARVGVDDAIRALLSEIEPLLVRHATRLTSRSRLSPDWRHQSASDLLQETRLRIWKGIAHFRGAADPDGMENCLRRWIVVVMQRAFLDMIDGNRPTQAAISLQNSDQNQSHAMSVAWPAFAEPPSADPSPSRNLRIDERAHRVREVIGRLAASDRAIIEQHFFRGRSLRDIAAELGMEYTRLRRRFHHVLATLGRELEEV
jgi:RNA polymerase sigma factor (sigma-70 family)